MPNWCENEIRFNVSDYNQGTRLMEEILDYVKESIPTYDRRIRVATKYAEINQPTRMPWEQEHISRSPLDFNAIIPYPQEYKQRDEDALFLSVEEFSQKYGPDAISKNKTYNIDGYNSGGYKWCIENWGSKWSARDVLWVPQRKTFYFNTAWAPVFPIVSAIHKQFPDVHIFFEYYERGAGMIGGCEYLPEADWDPADYTVEEVNSIEQRSKRGEKVTPLKYEAGRAYNPWSMDYMGFKGG